MAKLNKNVLLPIALVIANTAGLAVSLIIPFLLRADEYSVFAVTWGIGQLVASVAFEWLRYCVVRYSVGSDEALAATRRGMVLYLYVAIAATLLLLSALSFAITPISPLAGVAAAAIFYGVCQGLFDGRQARARALFDNAYYSLSWVTRTVLSLILSAAGAWLTGKGVGALCGLAISYPLTIVLMNGGRWPRVSGGQWRRDQFFFLIKYGFYAALATNFSWLTPAILRLVAVSLLGLSNASGFLLAVDLSQKAVSVVGLAVNIIIMQLSIKAVEFGSESDITLQARRQIGVSTVFIAPAALGLYLIYPSFTHLLISAEYQVIFSQTIGLCSLAAGIASFRMFSIDSLFIAFGNTRPAVFGPVLSLVALLLITWAFDWSMGLSAVKLALALVIASFLGTVIAALLLSKERSGIWPWADLAKVCTGCMVMFGTSELVRPNISAASLLLEVSVYGGVYIIAALALNTSGMRSLVKQIFVR